MLHCVGRSAGFIGRGRHVIASADEYTASLLMNPPPDESTAPADLSAHVDESAGSTDKLTAAVDESTAPADDESAAAADLQDSSAGALDSWRWIHQPRQRIDKHKRIDRQGRRIHEAVDSSAYARNSSAEAVDSSIRRGDDMTPMPMNPPLLPTQNMV